MSSRHVPLTEATKAIVRRLFAESEHAVVTDLLAQKCGVNLPITEAWTEVHFERVWLAVLKLSGGDIARLREAVQIAQIDWRDVLVASGFGTRLEAHREWADSLLT